MPVRRGFWLTLFLVFAAVLVSAAGVAVLSALFGSAHRVEPGSVLVIRLSGTLDEVEPGGVLRPFLPAYPTVRSLTENLRKAAIDPRIVGLVVIPNHTSALWGKVQEIREAVRAFRASGKRTVALLDAAGDEEYYLASACERIFLLPASTLDVDGLAAYGIFLRGTLDRLGIQPDLLHIGDYKTAINTWTERDFTPAHREMTESLNRDTFAELVRAIAEARGMTEDEVRALVDEGPFLPEDAMAAGLVDDLVYEDQIDDKVHFDAGPVSFIELDDYARVSARSLGLNRGPRIAVIYAVGNISGGRSQDTPQGPVLGSQSLIESIREARGDDSIKAIVLRIDSPGGSSVASDVIWRELSLTRPVKPLIVSMSDLAASGGYYIALPASEIVAQPGTLTGSIGIYGGKFVFGNALGKLGAQARSVKEGSQAGMSSPLEPYTPAARAKLEEQLESFYLRFVERVAQARHSTIERVDAIAQGRVWTGRQALALGLVDTLGGLDVALRRAKLRANIPAESDVEVVTYPPQKSLYELVSNPFDVLRMTGRPSNGVDAWLPDLLPGPERRAFLQAALPWRLYRPGEPLALMPFVVVR